MSTLLCTIYVCHYSIIILNSILQFNWAIDIFSLGMIPCSWISTEKIKVLMVEVGDWRGRHGLEGGESAWVREGGRKKKGPATR